MKSNWFILALAASAVGVLAGCSSGSSVTPAPTPAPAPVTGISTPTAISVVTAN
jgi:outer membrane murein-binding lipoprotein Lpp